MTTKEEKQKLRVAASEHYTVRDYSPSDHNAIYKAWLAHAYYDNEMFRLMPHPLFRQRYAPVLDRIISQATVKVACLIEDADAIVGFAVYRGDVLHFVAVKKPWRKLGVATALVPAGISTYTHVTTIGKAISRKKKWVFDPFVI